MSACNYCALRQLRARYGEQLIKVDGTWYLRDKPALPGQGATIALKDGTMLQFVSWFAAEPMACCCDGLPEVVEFHQDTDEE